MSRAVTREYLHSLRILMQSNGIRILKKLFFKEISIYNHFDVTVLWCPEFLVGWLLLMMLAFPLIKLFMHYHLACNSVIIFTMWIPHNCFASNHNVEKPKRILLLFLLVVFNNGDGLSIYVSVNLYTFICGINAENTRTILSNLHMLPTIKIN